MADSAHPRDIIGLEAYSLRLSRALRSEFQRIELTQSDPLSQEVSNLRRKLKIEWFRLLKENPPFNLKEQNNLKVIENEPVSPQKSASSRIVLVIKATRLCNLRCSYCNVWSDKTGQVMSFSTISRVVRQSLLLPNIKQVDFVWHGGEVTILKPKFFRKLMALQERYRQPGQVISNSIQTNATNLSEEWLGLISVLNLDVGISIDGPPEIHDRRRPTATGLGSSAFALDGLQRLREAGVNHGVLVVIDRETMSYPVDELLCYFSDSGIRDIDLLNYVPGNEDLYNGDISPAFISFPQFVQWMRNVYRVWVSNYRDRISIRFLEDLSEALRIGRDSTNCYFSGNCEKRVFTVDVDGSISPCDKFIGGPASAYGSVYREQFATIISAHSTLRKHADDAGNLSNLENCKWHSLCHGGCPHDRIAARFLDRTFDGSCCGLSGLLEDIWSNECSDRSMGTALKPAGHHLASINVGV